MRMARATLTGVGLAALSVGLAAPACAQDEESAEESNGIFSNEILVTANKKEERLSDVPMAISAVAGDELEVLGLDSATDLATVVPGFTQAPSRFGSPIYSIRGVGFNTENASSSSPVGVYVDEVSFPYPVMSAGLTFDIARVEVLKGPQGTLYGRNTTGGLVNFVSNRPTQDFEGSVRAGFGSFQTYEAEAVLSGPIGETLSARFAGKTVQSNRGWQRSASRPGDRLGEVDKLALRGSLLFEPSTNFSALLTASYWTDGSDTQAPQSIIVSPQGAFPLVAGFSDSVAATAAAAANGNPRLADWDRRPAIFWGGSTFTQPPQDFEKDVESWSVSLRMDLEASDNLTLTSLTSFAEYEQSNFLEQDGTPFESFAALSNADISTFSQELRLAGQFDDLDFVVGAFYSNDSNSENQQPWAGENSLLSGFRGFLAPFADSAFLGDPVFGAFHEGAWGFRNWENFVDVDNESWSIFGQADWRATDALTLTLGLRYTDDKADFQGCTRDNNGDANIHALWNSLFPGAFMTSFAPAAPGECVTFETLAFGGNSTLTLDPVSDSLNEDNLSIRSSIRYEFSPGSNVYASVSRGYKSGNFFLGAANVASQFAPVTQEKLWAYEVGLKAELTPDVFLNLAAYYYDYTDKQIFGRVADPIFTTLPALVNAPKSEVKGLEGDLTWNASDQFAMRLAASFMDTEFKEFTGFDPFSNPTDFAGSEFEYAPSFQFNWIGTYTQPLSDNLQAQLTVDVSHTSRQQGDFLGDSRFTVDPYTLVGANLAFGPPERDWEISVFVRNLTDEYYWHSSHLLTDAIVRYTGQPRTWGINALVNF